MFVLIDNYDSFTWNLWHFLSDLGADVEIIRNDACTAPAIIEKQPKGVIISPGPGIPKDAGMTIELISLCFESVVILTHLNYIKMRCLEISSITYYIFQEQFYNFSL